MPGNVPSAASADAIVLTRAQIVNKLFICLVYISVSMLLIRFNKLMMEEDRFPFALALSAFHMFVSSLLCGLLYLAVPSMFPAMASTMGHRCELMKPFLPIAACFAVMLYGSNKAYAYCGVALLQFMKEANAMLVFIISCVAGLQTMTRVRVALIIWVITSASISVSGDLKFSIIGIAIQAVSQICECTRMVLGELILRGRKLDPLTYTSFVSPLCFVVLLVGNLCNWDHQIVPAFLKSWHLLLLNAFVAFLLNVLVATLIKEISAVGYVLTGIIKDIFLVVLSGVIFSEPITMMQWSTFAMTLGGVGIWSLLKIYPDALIIRLLERMLCMPPREVKEDCEDAEEAQPLMSKKV